MEVHVRWSVLTRNAENRDLFVRMAWKGKRSVHYSTRIAKKCNGANYKTSSMKIRILKFHSLAACKIRCKFSSLIYLKKLKKNMLNSKFGQEPTVTLKK
jgi:hypothetical protein